MSMFQPPRGRGGGRGAGRGGDRGGSGRGGDFRGSSRGRGGGRGGYQSQPAEVFKDGEAPSPNPNVTKVEDSFMAQKSTLSGGMAGMSVTEDFPARPAYGTKGKPVVLWANYFELTASKNLTINRYHLSVSPEAKGRKLKRVIELLLQDPRLNGCATDFKSILVGKQKIPDMEVEIAYRSEFEDDPQPNTRPYRVKVQITGQMEVAALLNHLKSIQPDPNFRSERKLQIIQALNVLLGYYPQSNSSTTTIAGNKHYFFGVNPGGHGPRPEYDLGGGLTALRGYFRSVRQGTARMLVNINVSHAVFFKPGPLVDLINIFGNVYGWSPFVLEKFLKKIRVETTHLPVKKNRAGQKIPRVKTIIALASQNDGASLPHPPIVAKFGACAKDVKFWLESSAKNKTSKYITVAEFFEKQYKLNLKNSLFPVMNTGTRADPVYLPAECCMVLPGQASMKKLNPNQTAEMIRFACRRPHMNAKSITSDGPGVLGLDQASSSNLTSFGIKVNTDMITVPGRVLNAPTIKYRAPSFVNTKGGSWNMAGLKFTSGAIVPPWTYLWIKKARNVSHIEKNDQISDIITELHKMMNASGLVAPPVIAGKHIVLDSANPTQSNDELIDSSLKRASLSQLKIGLVFVILPDTDANIYNTVKYAGDVKYGVHTVCAIDMKVAKKERRDQYLANVVLKVNSKLLGINQSLDVQKLGIIAEGKTMVVGIDVTHPSPGSLSSAPSVAALVASTDKYLSQFPCELSIQESRKEMVTDLSDMFKSRLYLWKARNKILPENILVYRDGVSEGQYQVLKDTEIPALRAACDTIYAADQKKKGLPKISVIVVGKRHHTRFYATNQGDADRSGNPYNGTVVDRGVTSMWNWDFFLQAHTCLQGTAKPAHYYVVLDEIFGKGNLKKPHPFPNAADTLEDLTHNMCYLFTRATKAVSICPPAYYADLACERARCYLSGHFDPAQSGGSSVTGGTQSTASAADVTIHDRLKNSMFYI